VYRLRSIVDERGEYAMAGLWEKNERAACSRPFVT
jgi:hypothetical protein